MKSIKWLSACVLGMLMLTGNLALAQGKSHGKGHNKHGDDDDEGEHYYRDHDRDVRGWYDEHQSNLPPGLAKKDRLPPGKTACTARLAPAWTPKTAPALP